MIKRTWNKGFPPHTGWWNASTTRSEVVWRWFDASTQQWGQPCSKNVSNGTLMCAARTPVHQDESVFIEWTDYWPENARVPRIDPRRTK